MKGQTPQYRGLQIRCVGNHTPSSGIVGNPIGQEKESGIMEVGILCQRQYSGESTEKKYLNTQMNHDFHLEW